VKLPIAARNGWTPQEHQRLATRAVIIFVLALLAPPFELFRTGEDAPVYRAMERAADAASADDFAALPRCEK
jgi:hypothetical protein